MRTSSDVTLKTAVFEDFAATTGVVIAAVGVALVQITGESRYDGIASVLIGGVLIAVAIMLGIEARGLLLGSSAEDRVQRAIREQIEQHPEVDHIVELLTMQLGLNSVLVTGRLELRDRLDTDEIEALLDQIGDRIRVNVPSVQNIYLEPHPRKSDALSTGSP